MKYSFDDLFLALTAHRPFPWQRELFHRFVSGNFPASCDIPTGLGKTAAVAVWLLALEHRARAGTEAGFPRRLAYVVNRRTVVDQATREAESMRTALCRKPELRSVAETLRKLAAQPSDDPLAISTLRGEFADNAEWRGDPSRPAVIVGTVDMIGSRLLFSGYGCGFKSRPLHAGFLGQDALLVHDEAHLEPAFQALIEAIEREQRRCGDARPFRVMALTATSRAGGDSIALSDADCQNNEVRKRIGAKKSLLFHPVENEKKIADAVVERALEHKDSGKAILIFLRKLENVQSVVEKLRKTKLACQTLTGTLRGLERDNLAQTDEIFARFLRTPEPTGRGDTVYLVCTSAGEVGVNISADHMVSDLTPFDSMAQRLGRVNRFGDGDARIDVVHCVPEAEAGASPSPVDAAAAKDPAEAVDRTLTLLRRLPQREDGRHDASPDALRNLPPEDRQAAFTPAPEIVPVSDILFDAWSLTSIRGRMPGRPPVTDWLHGVAEWQPPETHVAWREDVSLVAGALLEHQSPRDLLEDYPLKPHELLRDSTRRVVGHLEGLAKRNPTCPVWVVDEDGSVRVTTLEEAVETAEEALRDRTVLLPPEAGGLERGMLAGSAAFSDSDSNHYDVADRAHGGLLRRRVWDDEEAPDGMRCVRTIDTRPEGDGEADGADGRRIWRWYVRPRAADDDGSKTAACEQDLETHSGQAKSFAARLVHRLALGDMEASAVALAAQVHDGGKRRAVWQRSIGNRAFPARVLAKSGDRRMRFLDLSHYRHELGSAVDLAEEPEFCRLEAASQDLVLHLIAAHHGRARPHFSAEEAFDPEHPDSVVRAAASEAPARFARLQRRYGRWGLAYLESLVRVADVVASQPQEAE